MIHLFPHCRFSTLKGILLFISNKILFFLILIMKEYAKQFYKSKRWQDMREYVMKRDKRLCQDCLKCGLITVAEEVHHIIPISPDNINDTAITLNEDNLISLCRFCHQARHNQHEQRFVISENGTVIPK